MTTPLSLLRYSLQYTWTAQKPQGSDNYSEAPPPISLSWLASSPTAQLYTRQDNNPAVSATPVAAYLAAQWRNPNDILSVLMLLGPDVIKSAITQLAGRAITLVAFSFGWVAYAPTALLSSLGGTELPIVTWLAPAFVLYPDPLGVLMGD
ncbi:hypothetical protein VM1G_12079 [Cytospora mali]|uniref:Uncharacterized protein n=1 Tax=Cytospora mali TaxID=578113 RepID=A0A194VKJ1_CYTMA|nr:hypothetical protein VM1G_12079 [Valsa mali]